MTYNMLCMFHCLTLIAFSSAFGSKEVHPLSDEYIDYINSKQNTWIAGQNFPKGTSMSQIRSMVGSQWSYRDAVKVISHENEGIVIPDSFDSREQWPDCASVIERIADQSACASDWAISATSAMSDRLCIHSNGSMQVYVSAANLISCYRVDFGCNTGSLISAWFQWFVEGIPSGGPFNSTIGCQAYPYPPCEHYGTTGTRPQCPSTNYNPKDCELECDNTSSLIYSEDLSHADDFYYIDATDVQLEIMKNGPITTTFDMYDDFPSYKSGVYKAVSLSLRHKIGPVSVKIFGWGIENGAKYWLAANSWNEDWGDNGFFKFLRGENHCDIESNFAAGTPIINETMIQ